MSNNGRSVPERAREILSLPNRDVSTSAQISSVLSVFNCASNFLLAAQMNEVEPRQGGRMDGGAKTAVETTIIKACDRLDALLEQQERWCLDTQLTMEKEMAAAYRENANMLREQAAAFRAAHSPHARYHPQLVKMEDGNWVAFVGNPEDLDNALVGMGAYPEQAIEAFDSLFRGAIPEHLQKLLNQPNEKNEQSKPVDPGTSGKIEASENDGEHRRGHSRNPGADDKGGGTQSGEAGADGAGVVD